MKALALILIAIALTGCGKQEEVSKVTWLTSIPEPHKTLLEMRVITASLMAKQGADLSTLPPLLPETQFYLNREKEAYDAALQKYIGNK